MADQAEQAFVKTFLNTLSTQPIAYADDYQQPPESWLKKVPVLPIPVPAPPARKQSEASTSSASISVVFKSLKPPASYSISIQPTDTIASIKAFLASQPTAPPADVQRLLLKGKALADNKLLKEYNIKDGDIVNLMVKPGFVWDPTKPAAAPAATPSPLPSPLLSPSPSSIDQKLSPTSNSDVKPAKKGHQRIPSVVLSPSPSSENLREKPMDITLTLDNTSPSLPSESLSTYHNTVAKPEFWERLHTFLRSEFRTDGDVLLAFEDFLCASKGTLTAFEIAKIRDHVGVVGMAGT